MSNNHTSINISYHCLKKIFHNIGYYLVSCEHFSYITKINEITDKLIKCTPYNMSKKVTNKYYKKLDKIIHKHDICDLYKNHTHITETKFDAILYHIKEIINRNKEERLLLFSNNNHVFVSMKELLSNNDIINRELKGNPTTINSVLKKFKNSEINILMLNDLKYGAGINLQCSDRIIICNKMHKDTMTQVIGRAQRYGRTTELKVDIFEYYD